MSKRLLASVRNLAQDCETISAACRKIERELMASQEIGLMDEQQIERMVRRVEGRAAHAFRRIGVH
jgi:hypothetical protein